MQPTSVTIALSLLAFLAAAVAANNYSASFLGSALDFISRPVVRSSPSYKLRKHHL